METMIEASGTGRKYFPSSEKLKRMLSETRTLKRILASYHYEPCTERQFMLRESIRERLSQFESRCRQMLARLPEQASQPTIGEMLMQLLSEFRLLESDTQAYTRQVRT